MRRLLHHKKKICKGKDERCEDKKDWEHHPTQICKDKNEYREDKERKQSPKTDQGGQAKDKEWKHQGIQNNEDKWEWQCISQSKLLLKQSQ